MTDRKIRVLMAKPGLDGHDVGAKVVVRAMLDAGYEVVYTGLRQSAEAIVRAAVQEDVDVIGLSILSGSHIPVCRELAGLLEERSVGDMLWLVGGNIPSTDVAALEEIGVDAVFRTGSRLASITQFIEDNVR